MEPKKKTPKPYGKLAATLVAAGMMLLMAERYGFSQWRDVHLAGWLLSLLLLVPLALVLSGCGLFVYGRMRKP